MIPIEPEKPLSQLSDRELVNLALHVPAGEESSWAKIAKRFVDKLHSFDGYVPTAEDPVPIQAIWEISKRFAGKKSNIYLKPRDIWEELRDIRGAKKEHFMVFFLDTRNQETHRETVSIGTLNYNLVHPREVFEPAVKYLAAGIIVAHNHPSGCLEPSDEDISLTKRLVSAGKLLGIEVLDHVIVTKDAFTSFKQKGLI
jgi:DNA repair protein RadC